MKSTKTKSQPKEKKKGQRRPKQQAEKLPARHASAEGQHPQSPEADWQHDEGLYALVMQDQLLRSYHTARLRNTPGYEHLSEEAAAGMAEQMLSLVTLICEMTMAKANQNKQPDYLSLAA